MLDSAMNFIANLNLVVLVFLAAATIVFRGDEDDTFRAGVLGIMLSLLFVLYNNIR